MVAIIAGLGTALPTSAMSTAEFIDHAKKFSCQTPKQERVLEELYRRTSIETRSSVLASRAYGAHGERMFRPPDMDNQFGPGTEERMNCYAQEVVPLALDASQRALDDAFTEAAAITNLITVSCTGFFAPGFDVALINQLPLDRSTSRTHVGFMGCHGAMNAMRVGKSFVEANPDAVVLLCTAELCSLHFQYGWETNKLLANSLFSDGSAALVIRNAKESIRGEWQIVDSTSYIVPDSLDAMEWRLGNNGFQMKLSSKVPELVESVLRGWLAGWLSKFDLSITDIAQWAVHPGGPRIVDVVQKSLELPPEALAHSRAILSECGNMSSPTVLFILERMRSLGATGPCVMLGFGPGLTVEASLLVAS